MVLSRQPEKNGSCGEQVRGVRRTGVFAAVGAVAEVETFELPFYPEVHFTAQTRAADFSLHTSLDSRVGAYRQAWLPSLAAVLVRAGAMSHLLPEGAGVKRMVRVQQKLPDVRSSEPWSIARRRLQVARSS